MMFYFLNSLFNMYWRHIMKLWAVVEDYDNMAIEGSHYFYDNKIRGVYETYISAQSNMSNNIHSDCKIVEHKEGQNTYKVPNSLGYNSPLIIRRIVKIDTNKTQDGIYNDPKETRYMYFTLRRFQ